MTGVCVWNAHPRRVGQKWLKVLDWTPWGGWGAPPETLLLLTLKSNLALTGDEEVGQDEWEGNKPLGCALCNLSCQRGAMCDARTSCFAITSGPHQLRCGTRGGGEVWDALQGEGGGRQGKARPFLTQGFAAFAAKDFSVGPKPGEFGPKIRRGDWATGRPVWHFPKYRRLAAFYLGL